MKRKSKRLFSVFHATFPGLVAVVAISLLTSCTGMKYVPENEALYTGYEIDLKPRKKLPARHRIKELMDQNVSPKPNTKILGMRPTLWFYYVAGDAPREKRFRYFVKNKLGQAPVYMRDVDADKTSKLIQGHLVNNGYFHAKVTSKVEIEDRKGKVIYTAQVHRPYRLRNIEYPKDDTLFTNIDSIKVNSFLKTQQRYNLERLQAEQQRIEKELENFGYYFFDDRYLLFEADSTVGKKQVDLLLTLEPEVPKKATRIYRIGRVTIYPDYSLAEDSLIRSTEALDLDGYRYVDRKKNYRPKIITRVINLKEGNTYRREDREYTLSHLMGLGSFKFVDIKFRESRRDSTILNTSIYLTPFMKKSIRAEAQLTSKSNNFVGPGFTARFTNRNFLGGSERFDITLNTGYEVQYGRKTGQPLNAFELGIESGLSFPRFISPFDIHYPSRKYLPSTDIKLGFRVQQRIGFFRLNSFNLEYGYTWRENTLKTHELYPIDINYMRLGKTSAEFDTLISKNQFLARSLENQFIMGARYSYTLNTQVNEERNNTYRETRIQRSHFYFNAKLESAGNLVHLIRGGEFDSDPGNDSLKIFGSAYSQFIRGEIDFRHYWNLDEKNVIAARIVGGTGYAYGNSVTMPYIRQFSVGGSNSVRAFPARSIGPGTYDVTTDQDNENNILFLDQRGDVKLEGSVEYRVSISRVVKGAVFADAGNIWLWSDPEAEGKQFDRRTFFSELAVGTGAGVRFDFSFFVLRFDVAFPLRKPFLPKKERWVFDKIDLGSSSWRSDNLILNIAIGYPF
jgi:outer membrane protein insertion porin family